MHSHDAFDLMKEPSLADFAKRLFTADFMPHGHCFFWRPEILWLHVASDFTIGLAYYLIPFALFRFVRKRHDLIFNWMFILFAVFIFACGTTHFMNIWTMWYGAYRIDGLIKLFTAIASLGTAVLLIPLIPKALLLRSPAQLEAEVKQRTAELQEKNESLRILTKKVEETNQELIRSNRELEQFAYVAAHDLQEPLRTVTTFTDYLQHKLQGKLTGEEREYLGMIFRGGERAQLLIRDLLGYSRAGVKENELVTVQTRQILDKVVLHLKQLIEESKAEITIEPLPEVIADESQLQQIFQNLIENAIKYRRKDVPLEIKVSAADKGPEWLFSVEDNGIGIAPEHHDRIFQLFQRLHLGTRGTGIGLAICKKIAERHGGHIWVRSEEGAGASFHFTISKQPQASPRFNPGL